MTFNYAAFILMFPALSNINAAQAQMYWSMAGLYFDTQGWPSGLPQAQTLMMLLTAHLIYLYGNRDATGAPSSSGTQLAPAIVGRISSASQGSVSMQTDFESNSSPSAAWYNQTPPGAAYWAATAQFRTAVLIPSPRRLANVRRPRTGFLGPGVFGPWN